MFLPLRAVLPWACGIGLLRHVFSLAHIGATHSMHGYWMALGRVMGSRDAGGADVFATRALPGLALGNICGDGIAAFRQTGLGVCGRFGLFVGFAV